MYNLIKMVYQMTIIRAHDNAKKRRPHQIMNKLFFTNVGSLQIVLSLIMLPPFLVYI